MRYKQQNSVLLASLLTVLLMSGCKKNVTSVQQKRLAVTTLNDLYNTFSLKYQKELRYLSSGKKKSHISKKIIEYVTNKKYGPSFSDFLFPKLKAEYIPVHTYLSVLDKDIKKLETQEKCLSKMNTAEKFQEIGLKIKNLSIDLFEVKLILSKSRDFREEARYLSIVK